MKKTSMSIEMREKLKARKKENRAKICLLKDLSPFEILIWIDRAEEQRGLRTDIDLTKHAVGYMSRASAGQIAALRSRLPHVKMYVYSRVGRREVCCFQAEALREIFRGVLTKPSTYLRYWRDPFPASFFEDNQPEPPTRETIE